ncbi:hypothetical protein BC629DRAFT_1537375 [Irpex lacteus]|nr:hypothetical protein BC629DRAFT_1537375 [Irpex lacteus]
MDTMEDVAMEDEKKPFDAEHAGNEDDTQPDPDEELIMQANNGRVWLVKIPRHLMEQWCSIDEEGVKLATIRVYQKAYSATLPDGPNVGTDTIMTGRVKHECNLRPQLSDKYRQRLKQRRIEDEHPGDRGTINRLTSGVTNTEVFRSCPESKATKRAVRAYGSYAPQPALDMLFGLFREREHWPVRLLRERTSNQKRISKRCGRYAFMHRSGEHNGTWELMANFKGEGIKGENVPGPSLSGDGMDEDDDEDEDDEDDDMEEVS